MKLNPKAKVFFSSAIVAALSLMVACAPAKKGSKFADRGGSVTGQAEAEKLSGIPASTTEANKKFADQIVSVQAVVEDAIGEDGNDQLDQLKVKRLKDSTSGIEQPQKTDATAVTPDTSKDSKELTGALEQTEVSNERGRHLVTVRINMVNVGFLDFMGENTKFGNADVLHQLTELKDDCAKKYPLTVRAACADKICMKLLIQIRQSSSAERGAEVLHVEQVLTQASKNTDDGSYINTIKFSAFDRTDELAANKIQVQKTMAICKADQALVPTTDETPVKASSGDVIEGSQQVAK